MSVLADNVRNLDEILELYNAIVDGAETNWLLLQYGDNNTDDVFLLAYGSEGLSGVKTKVSEDAEQVYFAFYREEVKARPGFAIINYVPPAVSGVRRARALVLSRRIGSNFSREEHASLTVDHLSNLTPTAIHEAILNPESSHSIQIEQPMALPATPSDITNQLSSKRTPRAIRIEPVRRSFTETYAPDKVPITMQKTSSLFSGLLRRKGGRKDIIAEIEEPAPPTPPKDMSGGGRRQPPAAYTVPSAMRSQPQYTPQRRVSEFGHDLDHATSSSDEGVMVERPPPSPSFSPPVLVPLDGKWSSNGSSTIIADPAERARRRQVAREQKQKEEQQAMKEEMQRQFQQKLRKDEIRRQEREDEERRKAELERELRRNTEARKRKEQLEREEEQRRRLEIEQRKKADRERRLEEHRRLEEWRLQQAKTAEDAIKREEAAKRREANERKKKIAQVEAKVKSNSKSEDLVTGWVTMQTSENIVWRRRYYRMIGNTLFLYRSPKDMHQVLDEVTLRGRVTGLREWNEGYEELKAIPHSFAVEFKDSRGPWGMFCDEEEDKIKLLGLLHYAAGL